MLATHRLLLRVFVFMLVALATCLAVVGPLHQLFMQIQHYTR